MASISPLRQQQDQLRKNLNVGIRIPDRIRPLPKSTVIGFDDVASDSVIDNHYSSQGVSFAAVLKGKSAKGHVWARNSWNIETAPNGVTVVDPKTGLALFDDATGYVEVSFADPHRLVSIDALPIASPDDFRPITAKPYLEAYDAAGNRLGRVVYAPNHGDASWGTWQRLLFDAGASTVRSLRIGSERNNGCPVYGLFDQLTFSNDMIR